MRSERGWSRRDTLGLVVILAALAFFAVPSVVRDEVSINERAAVAALREIVRAESTWRSTDPDGNGLNDYWVYDVAGFYGMQDRNGAPLKHIDVNLARRDAVPMVSYAGRPAFPPADRRYKFRAMIMDDKGGRPTPYRVNYVPSQKSITVLRHGTTYGYATACNSYCFGFEAVPETYNSGGVRCFIVNEAGVIYGVDRGNNTFTNTWPGTDPTAKTKNGRYWTVVR